MTHKTVTYIPQEKFLSVRLLTAVFWVSFFAIQWCRVFGIGDLNALNRMFWAHLLLAVGCSLITYGVNVKVETAKSSPKDHFDKGRYD